MAYKNKEHRKAYWRAWYKENRADIIAHVKRHRNKRLAEIGSWINELKSKPCADCKNTFHPVAMDFDHVKGKKIQNVSRLIRDGYSLDKIKLEIAKCEVVCANCHRIRTFSRKLGRGATR